MECQKFYTDEAVLCNNCANGIQVRKATIFYSLDISTTNPDSQAAIAVSRVCDCGDRANVRASDTPLLDQNPRTFCELLKGSEKSTEAVL